MATGQVSSAFGYGASTSGDNSIANGHGSNASGIYTIATGINASATGPGSVVYGSQATASASNSVALGFGSVANEAYTVSVGSTNSERRITHVADGVAASDAATFGRLTQTNNRVANLATNIETITSQIAPITKATASGTGSVGSRFSG